MTLRALARTLPNRARIGSLRALSACAAGRARTRRKLGLQTRRARRPFGRRARVKSSSAAATPSGAAGRPLAQREKAKPSPEISGVAPLSTLEIIVIRVWKKNEPLIWFMLAFHVVSAFRNVTT